jgi:TPP-dependent pyruvate/acetoin dehydrogenase alpha subunit
MFETELLGHGVLTEKEVQAVREDVEKDVADGFTFAQGGTDPTPDTVLRDVYTVGGVT